jgi:hypothetical protein
MVFRCAGVVAAAAAAVDYAAAGLGLPGGWVDLHSFLGECVQVHAASVGHDREAITGLPSVKRCVCVP